MELPTLLFADGFDTLLKLAVFLLFFLGPALGKLFMGGGNQQPQAPPVPNPGGRPRPLPPPRPVNPPAPEDRLEQEIEAFLRRRAAIRPRSSRKRAPVPSPIPFDLRSPIRLSWPSRLTCHSICIMRRSRNM